MAECHFHMNYVILWVNCVTLHIGGQEEVSIEEFATLDEENQEPITTLNYLHEGD